MKQLLAILFLSVICALCAVGFTACGGSNTADTRDQQIVSIYNTYVAHAEETGETPKSYDEWIASIKGKDGKDGKSAYEIWLYNGHTGTEEDFLNWLKGKDEPTYYTVNFDSDGGTEVTSIQVENCKKCAEPATPTRYGYTFDGWYIKNEQWSFIGYVITEDITLTAKWSIDETCLNMFDWEKTETGYRINELKDKTVRDIIIPDFVTRIDYNAFSGCQIENAKIPAFACSYIKNDNLKTVEITSGERLGSGLAHCTSLESIIISDSVINMGSTIGMGDFEGCTSLSSVTIKDEKRITLQIAFEIFNGCDNLQYNEYDNGLYLGNNNNPYLLLVKAKTKDITSCITHPDTKYIAGSAFENCTALVSITFSDNITTIGNSAFRNCTALTSITIPEKVFVICQWAFNGCTALTTVKLSDNILTSVIDMDSFEDCDNLQYNEYDNAYYLGSETNPYLVLAKAKTKDITSCIIHDNTKIIAANAFDKCNLLENITIGNSVEGIGYDAFDECYNLHYNEYDNACYLGNNANPYFVLTTVKTQQTASLVCHDSTKIIVSYAFQECKRYLTSITLPESVEKIDVGAFAECYLLTSVNYLGTMEQWNNINKKYYWAYGTNITQIVCTDGVIEL